MSSTQDFHCCQISGSLVSGAFESSCGSQYVTGRQKVGHIQEDLRPGGVPDYPV